MSALPEGKKINLLNFERLALAESNINGGDFLDR
jgi:hypothetical protein